MLDLDVARDAFAPRPSFSGANMAQIRQSKSDPGHGFQVKVLTHLQAVPSSEVVTWFFGKHMSHHQSGIGSVISRNESAGIFIDLVLLAEDVLELDVARDAFAPRPRLEAEPASIKISKSLHIC